MRWTIFDFYAEGLKNVTEAPPQFHQITLMAVIGAMIGRKLFVQIGKKPLYPNLYVVLVGESATARKSTALSYVKNYTKPFTDKSGVHWISGVNSFEGLLTEMQDNQENAKSFIHVQGELASLLKVAQRQNTGNLIPGLTELYDCPPDYSKKVKKKEESIRIERPFLSILTTSTIAWINSNLFESDIFGGFANRFVYIPGNRKKLLPFPEYPSSEFEVELGQRLERICDFIDKQAEEPVKFTDEAKSRYSEFYTEFYNALDRINIDHQRGALKRIPDHVHKIALIIAVSELKSSIDGSDMSLAVEWGWKLSHWGLRIFNEYGKDIYLRVYEKIIELLRKNPERMLPRSELQRNIRNKGVNRNVFNQVIQEMADEGYIRIFSEPGSRKNMVELIHDPQDATPTFEFGSPDIATGETYSASNTSLPPNQLTSSIITDKTQTLPYDSETEKGETQQKHHLRDLAEGKANIIISHQKPDTSHYDPPVKGNVAEGQLWLVKHNGEEKVFKIEKLYFVPNTAKKDLDIYWLGKRFDKPVEEYLWGRGEDVQRYGRRKYHKER